MASDTTNPSTREKVSLQPGRHLMDWVRFNSAQKKGSEARRITAKELATHASRHDCWTALQGRVYDITQYLSFHPGGEPKLLLGAGKDCTDLFNKYHRWVNGHSMLSNCFVGIYVGDEAKPAEEKEEEAKIEVKINPVELRSQAIQSLDLAEDDEKLS